MWPIYWSRRQISRHGISVSADIPYVSATIHNSGFSPRVHLNMNNLPTRPLKKKKTKHAWNPVSVSKKTQDSPIVPTASGQLTKRAQGETTTALSATQVRSKTCRPSTTAFPCRHKDARLHERLLLIGQHTNVATQHAYDLQAVCPRKAGTTPGRAATTAPSPAIPYTILDATVLARVRMW